MLFSYVLGSDLHHGEVLVDLGGGDAEHGGELVLVGRDLAVAGAQRDAQHEALVLQESARRHE